MDRVARKKEEKRARIRTAALTLFRDRGWAGTTIRAVADEADVATGTVLAYFDSKVGLLSALFVGELEALSDARWRSMPSDAALIDQLMHLFEGFFEYYAAEPELSRVFVRETIFIAEPQAKAYDALGLDFIGRLATLIQRRGTLRPGVDAGLVGTVAFSLYLTGVATFLRSETPQVAPAMALLRATLEPLLEALGLRPPDGPGPLAAARAASAPRGGHPW